MHLPDPPAGFLPERLVQLHGSGSGQPAACLQGGEAPPLAAWLRALPRLKAEGYTHVQLAVGDRPAWIGLADLAAAARDHGLRVSLLCDGQQADMQQNRLFDALDELVVQVVRGDRATDPQARADAPFLASRRHSSLAQAGRLLAQRADRGRPATALLSVDRAAVAEAHEVAEHLIRQGAGALQVRPYDAHEAGVRFFSDTDKRRLYQTVVSLAQALAPRVRVQGSLAVASLLWQQRETYAGLLAPWPRPGESRARLSDMVNPLVISETGQLKPVSSNMHACFNIGHLHRLHDEPWLQRYARSGVSALQRLVGGGLIRLEYHPGVVDWLADLARASHDQPLARPLQHAASTATIRPAAAPPLEALASAA